MFLKAFPIIKGTVASIGYPASSERPAKFLIPYRNLISKSDGLMLKTSSGMMTPLS